MALHGIDSARIEWGDTINNPLLIEDGALMRFDVVVANPPFSLDKWGQENALKDQFTRFKRGIPPKGRGDFAFISHMIQTAREGTGRVGVIAPHGVLFRGGQEGVIRQALIEENLLEAVVGLPERLFYGTGIPAAILLFNKGKKTFATCSNKSATPTWPKNSKPAPTMKTMRLTFPEGTLRPDGSAFATVTHFRELVLNFLWRQWSALGVAGQARIDDPWCVDPEALLLFTTTQARFDPRLFDEMLDWLWDNAQWLNVQRLKNLQKSVPLGHPRVMAAIASWLSQRSTLNKWRPLAQHDDNGAPEALFLQKDLTPLPMFGAEDEVFLRYRWHRAPVKRRELSQPPNPHQAAALLCKLRALFGVSARCEVLLWLLAHESGRPADIARATAWFPKTVENTLNEMSGSGLIRSARHGREKHYWVKPEDWRFLQTWSTPEGFPQWIEWPRLFSALEQILFQLMRSDLSPMLLASELRRVMEGLVPVLADGRLLAQFTSGDYRRAHPVVKRQRCS